MFPGMPTMPLAICNYSTPFVKYCNLKTALSNAWGQYMHLYSMTVIEVLLTAVKLRALQVGINHKRRLQKESHGALRRRSKSYDRPGGCKTMALMADG